MKLVTDRITIKEIEEMAKKMFGNLIKAVVDVEKEIMAIDGELHSDEQALLIEKGSKPANLWGINIYPQKAGKDFIEFDSVINIRPSQQNRSWEIEDKEIKKKIFKIVNQLIIK
jgi:hypothetical protein